MIVIEPVYIYRDVPDDRRHPETYSLAWQVRVRADFFTDDEGNSEEHAIDSARSTPFRMPG